MLAAFPVFILASRIKCKKYMNEATIRQWYDIFKGNKDLVEIRVLDPESKRSYSGYFTDIETLLREIKPYDKCNLYFTLNVINQA